MVFTISDIKDIGKLLSALELKFNGKFKVSKQLLNEVAQGLYRLAKEKGVSVKVVSPTGERILEVTAKGILVGACIGFYFGQIPGAIIGAGIGGIAGYAKSHFEFEMATHADDDFVIFRTV